MNEYLKSQGEKHTETVNKLKREMKEQCDDV